MKEKIYFIIIDETEFENHFKIVSLSSSKFSFDTNQKSSHSHNEWTMNTASEHQNDQGISYNSEWKVNIVHQSSQFIDEAHSFMWEISLSTWWTSCEIQGSWLKLQSIWQYNSTSDLDILLINKVYFIFQRAFVCVVNFCFNLDHFSESSLGQFDTNHLHSIIQRWWNNAKTVSIRVCVYLYSW